MYNTLGSFVIQVSLRMKDICDIMYTNIGNYIICLLIDGIYAKISNINIIKQKHLVRLYHDFELFVKFMIYKINGMVVEEGGRSRQRRTK